MRSVYRVLIVVAIVCVPTLAAAQGSITGVIKDSSGAVLPGVTVEVASPVLIEKIRSAVTDGTGQFRIIDLRPGADLQPGVQPRWTLARADDGDGCALREGLGVD